MGDPTEKSRDLAKVTQTPNRILGFKSKSVQPCMPMIETEAGQLQVSSQRREEWLGGRRRTRELPGRKLRH